MKRRQRKSIASSEKAHCQVDSQDEEKKDEEAPPKPAPFPKPFDQAADQFDAPWCVSPLTFP
jgi:hypothetical protein